jgi:hypothetical protein
MAVAMDTQMSDLSHGTLMGLQELDQELDSHLAIFESSNPRDSSTPGAISVSTVGESINATENTYRTIVVESTSDSYSHKFQHEIGSRAIASGKPSVINAFSPYVLHSNIAFYSILDLQY